MPKLPPPPRRPQNRSAFSSVLAVSKSAVGGDVGRRRSDEVVRRSARTCARASRCRCRASALRMPVVREPTAGDGEAVLLRRRRRTHPRSVPAARTARTVRASVSIAMSLIGAVSITKRVVPQGPYPWARNALRRGRRSGGRCPPEAHGRLNVSRIHAPRDERRVRIEVSVPDRAHLVVARVAWLNQAPRERCGQSLHCQGRNCWNQPCVPLMMGSRWRATTRCRKYPHSGQRDCRAPADECQGDRHRFAVTIVTVGAPSRGLR